MAVTPPHRPAGLIALATGLWLAGSLVSAAFAQTAPRACPVQPRYPLPKAEGELLDLSEHLDGLAQQAGCLGDAGFHAYRGAVLMQLGRAVEAVEPLERALLTNPDLFGAQMDLAQAHAAQGDRESAASLLEDLRRRSGLPPGMSLRLDREIAALRAPAPWEVAARVAGGWHTSWQVSSMAGHDTNLNNAPSASQLTLTLPQGDVTLPLDPASLPKKGPVLLSSAQWQGLKPQGESVWVVQAEGRARHTGDRATSYQQVDAAINWLQAPLAQRQWVARLGAGYFRFGGETLLWASRASVQYQWESLATGLGGVVARCRPTAAIELERRLYPATRNIDGSYRGGAAGLLCRPATEPAASPPVLSLQARLGEEQPFDDTRAGGVYRRAELRGQLDGRFPWKSGQYTLRMASTRQTDSAPYSVLLGNVPRKTWRHTVQLDTAWPLTQGLSLITTFEGALQRSNLPAFDARQTGLYLGLRWESM